jgi:hypothetical protein
MAPSKAKDEGPEFFYVRSALDENRVALHEVDEKHPGGSVLVAGKNPVKVGNTKFVKDRLRDGFLVEVSGDRARKQADKMAADRAEMFPVDTGDEDEMEEHAEPNKMVSYQDQSVTDLRTEATSRGIKLPDGANKGEIITALQKHDEENKVNG